MTDYFWEQYKTNQFHPLLTAGFLAKSTVTSATHSKQINSKEINNRYKYLDWVSAGWRPDSGRLARSSSRRCSPAPTSSSARLAGGNPRRNWTSRPRRTCCFPGRKSWRPKSTTWRRKSRKVSGEEIWDLPWNRCFVHLLSDCREEGNLSVTVDGAELHKQPKGKAFHTSMVSWAVPAGEIRQQRL